MIGNRSKLYAEPPDWVLLDKRTGAPHVQMRMYGETRWFQTIRGVFILDATILKRSITCVRLSRIWRRDWDTDILRLIHALWFRMGTADVVYHTREKPVSKSAQRCRNDT
jgi:hypothetical protein